MTNILQVYIFAVVMVLLGFLFGYEIGKTLQRDRDKYEMRSAKDDLERVRKENERLASDQKREIMHAISNEWNRGYDAAWTQLKHDFLFIRQWNKEHGIHDADVINFQNNEEENEK